MDELRLEVKRAKYFLNLVTPQPNGKLLLLLFGQIESECQLPEMIGLQTNKRINRDMYYLLRAAGGKLFYVHAAGTAGKD